MVYPKNRIVLSSFLAFMVYFAPYLVQDYHRFLGHHDVHPQNFALAGMQLQNQSEVCPVCNYEFTVIDENVSFVYDPHLFSISTVYVERIKNQILNSSFLYFNLRAPPHA